jgi:succinoglycan biosynthesis protein ExoM
MPESLLKPHISVCICTYKRPRLLKKLLMELDKQVSEELFTYSIVVADNDRLESAKPIVEEFAAQSRLGTVYCVQIEQNISLTRNEALKYARGDFIAFIDDDEFPIPNWLVTLFKACEAHAVDGAIGPVKPFYEQEPPRWVLRGRFHERPTYQTGFVLDWRKGRTGNLLFRSKILCPDELAFRPEFLTGEDQDFFSRMIEKGHVFIWCNEAVAYEVVPPVRWNRLFMLKRALLRGKTSLKHRSVGMRDILTSIAALPLYSLALPFLLLIGQHEFMRYLVKLFDHLGRLLALLGIDPIKEKYVTQ